jgi:competence protein ComFC
MTGFPHLLKFRSSFLDLLYPPVCELCGTGLTGARSLCDECADSLPRLRDPFCATCGECHDGRIDSDFDCRNCAKMRFAFEFSRPVLRRDPRSLDLVHRLKYGRRIHLAHSLGALLCEALEDPRFQQALAEKWALVPVPLHRSRMRARHFNQARELAQVVSSLTELPLRTCLQRIRSTGTQTALGRKARQKNLKGAFRVTHCCFRQVPVPDTGVILVDDVFTTGSTLHECATTLRKAGCPSVIALTLLRG